MSLLKIIVTLLLSPFVILLSKIKNALSVRMQARESANAN